MNIFYVDKSPMLAAQYLGDKHVVKMILESAQILSTAKNIQNGSQIEGLYKSAYVNHPCNKWVRAHDSHYNWLHEHLAWLCSEYTHRYKKSHKVESLITPLFKKDFWYECVFTPPPLCMPDIYKLDDSVESYREYYKKDKKHLHKWTNRETPYWINNGT